MTLAVVIRVHGKAPYVFDAVNSVLSQKCSTPIDLWLILDRVAPKTKDEIYRRLLPDVRVFVPKSSGYSAPLNELLMDIDSEFVAILDSDDEMVQGRLEMQFQFLLSNPGIAVVGSSITLINELGHVCGERVFQTSSAGVRERRFDSLPVAHPSVMFVRSSVIQVGGYRKFYDFAEDYDLWLRILEVSEIANLPQFLTRYRVHADQTNSLHIRRNVLAGVVARKSGIRRARGHSDYSEDYPYIERMLLKPRILLEVYYRTFKRILWGQAITANRNNLRFKLTCIFSLLILIDFKEAIKKIKDYK